MDPPFSISVTGSSGDHLPSAHTCMNQLVLPQYQSKAEMRTKLLQAIETTGFGFI